MALETIGKYSDLKLVGQGGMAEVYLATDPTLERRVAIKVIQPQLEVREGFAERFFQEAKTLAGLRHANIVQIHELDIHESSPYMVMEYLGGGSLEQKLEDYAEDGKSMPLAEIESIINAVCSALDHAHTRGIVHRDIKPANIMFSSNGEPVMVDFGIAKIVNDSVKLTATGGFIGTPQYASPEQFDGQPVEKEGDIYSLGIMLYEMVTGDLPFNGSFVTVLLQHLNDPPPSLTEWQQNAPRKLESVIHKALEKSPADRYKTASDLASDLSKTIQKGNDATPPITEKRPSSAAGKTDLHKLLEGNPNNLPFPQPQFFGREQLMDEIITAITANPPNRLITLSGPGGVGKTRLSIEIGYRLVDTFADGCFIVEVETARNSDELLTTLAHVFDIKDSGSEPLEETISNALAGKHALVILDNFEQLVRSGSLISKLSDQCKNLFFLVSSREILRLEQEKVIHVPPLAISHEGNFDDEESLMENPAISMFIERAKKVNAGIQTTPDSLEDISQICTLLEGLPLAIELAAARSRIFSPAELHERLRNDFHLLSKKSHDLPKRQTTIEGAIRWSYDLLEGEERILFERLGIFKGGWTVEALEKVCATGLEHDVIDLLEALIDKNIVIKAATHSDSLRFRLFEMVRVFALELFDKKDESEKDQIIEQYLDFYSQLSNSRLPRSEAVRIIPQTEAELINIKHAFELAKENERFDMRLLIAVNIWKYWQVRGGLKGGIAWLHAALEECPDGPKELIGEAHLGLSVLLNTIHEEAEARERLDQAYAVFQEINDFVGMAKCLNMYAQIAIGEGNPQKGIEHFEEGILIVEGKDDEILSLLSSNLGYEYIERGEFERARGVLEKALELAVAERSAPDIYWAQYLLAKVAFKSEDYKTSREYVNSALIQILKIRTFWGLGVCLPLLGYLEILDGEYARGIVMCAAAEHHRILLEIKLDENEQIDLDHYLNLAFEALGEQETEKYWEEGRKMDFDEAVRYALQKLDALLD